MILLLFSILLASTNAAHVISLYGDVHKDVEFFTRTFPWIIDNIGGEIIVEYNLLGSGRYSVPQMCALEDLKLNTFLQAQYLKCEAEGKPNGYCLCEAGIDPQKFKQCVTSGGLLATLASAKYTELGINLTPVIELEPNKTVYGTEDISFLKEVCTIFGNNLPKGCVNYSNLKDFSNKKAYAQFDRACDKEFPISDDVEKPVTTTERSTWETTTTTENIRTTSTPPPWSTTPTPWWLTTPPPWSTTPPPEWFTTTTPTPTTTPGCTTGLDWWSTTPPPWVTRPPTEWYTTSTPTPTTTPGCTTGLDWWSTTPPPWSTTPPPWWFTTQPPWSTRPPTEWPPWSTTPPPWWFTTPEWWQAKSGSNQNEENDEKALPEYSVNENNANGEEALPKFSVSGPPWTRPTNTPWTGPDLPYTTTEYWPWPDWKAKLNSNKNNENAWHEWKAKLDLNENKENEKDALPKFTVPWPITPTPWPITNPPWTGPPLPYSTTPTYPWPWLLKQDKGNGGDALPKFTVPWPITPPPWPITNPPWTGPPLPYSTTPTYPWPWLPKQDKGNGGDALPKFTVPWPITPPPWPITNPPWTGPPLPYSTTPTWPWPWLLKQDKGNDDNKISEAVAPEAELKILADKISGPIAPEAESEILAE